jgi:hypothetical protein
MMQLKYGTLSWFEYVWRLISKSHMSRESWNHEIDGYLKSVFTFFPIPIVGRLARVPRWQAKPKPTKNKIKKILPFSNILQLCKKANWF